MRSHVHIIPNIEQNSMSVLTCTISGVKFCAVFGVPSIFLSEERRCRRPSRDHFTRHGLGPRRNCWHAAQELSRRITRNKVQKSTPDNWQRDLGGTLEAYQQDLPIARRLADQDISDTGWQEDLVTSYKEVGDLMC